MVMPVFVILIHVASFSLAIALIHQQPCISIACCLVSNGNIIGLHICSTTDFDSILYLKTGCNALQ